MSEVHLILVQPSRPPFNSMYKCRIEDIITLKYFLQLISSHIFTKHICKLQWCGALLWTPQTLHNLGVEQCSTRTQSGLSNDSTHSQATEMPEQLRLAMNQKVLACYSELRATGGRGREDDGAGGSLPERHPLGYRLR